MHREGKLRSGGHLLTGRQHDTSSNSDPVSSPDVVRRDAGAKDATGLTLCGDLPRRTRPLTVGHVKATYADPALAHDVIKIRLARSRATFEQASTLIERRYSWRGYQTPGLHTDPNLRTFVAHANGVPMGTVSLRVDSETGLSADQLYKDELSEVRATHVRLCEFTRLAVEGDTVSKPVLGALFHTAVLYGHAVRDCDYAVIEVNPRHAVFYRRALFFESIGPERLNQQVNAPAVLLGLSLPRLAEEITKYFSTPQKGLIGRSFFAHWFPPDEAAGVLNRLHQLQA